ncbi:MAG: penicillin-binding protein activator [Deltaproteobacteria bacterium]|nr:penicillin-binding protein activator [Deltaproteobacteria bacterium]
MKPTLRIITLTALIFLCACGPKQKIFVRKAGPGEQLFSKAEKEFRDKAYIEALEIYNEYLSRFSDGPLVDAALMQIGVIYEVNGEHEKARNVYHRLITEHAASPYVTDAKIGILTTYYNQGDYQTVIEQASGILKDMPSRAQIVKMFVLLGDTHMAMDLPLDALSFYIKADYSAGPVEKKKIAVKLKEAIRQMGSADIITLLEQLEKDEMIAALLMYQLGLNRADEEKYDDAIRILSEFAERFPEQENVQQAKHLIEDLKKKSIYSRYTLGCILPLSGPYKIYGQRALKGIELALNQFGSGDVHPSLKIIVKDTESDPVMAAVAVSELFDEHVAAVIGPIITADSAAQEAQERGIPIITLTQKEDVTGIGDYVFRNFITPKMQVKTIVSYAFEVLGSSRFAIFYPDEKYGDTFMNLFWDEVIAHGGKIVGLESYNSAETDFSDDIKKLAGLYHEVPQDLKDTRKLIEEANMYGMEHFGFIHDFDSFLRSAENEPAGLYGEIPGDHERVGRSTEDETQRTEEEPEPIIDFDGIFIPDSPNIAGLIIPQLAFHDIENVNLFGTNLWHSDKLIEMSERYVQGAILTDGFFAESASPKVRDFVRLFEETYNDKPGFIEAVAYDTALILLQLLNRPDIHYRSALRDQLLRVTNFAGVTGLTSFSIDGESKKELYLLQIKKGRFVQLAHPGRDDTSAAHQTEY